MAKRMWSGLPLLLACACNGGGASPAVQDAEADETVATTDEALIAPSGVKHFCDATQPNTVNVCFNGGFLPNGTTSTDPNCVDDNGNLRPVANGIWTSSNASFATEIGWIKAAIRAQWGANTGITFNFYDTCPSPIPAEYVPITLTRGNWYGDIGGVGGWNVGTRFYGPNGTRGDYACTQGMDRETQLTMTVHQGHEWSERIVKSTAV
ncbi:MAG TPA: hypothetical protein VIV60_27580, partial [Polyangiaceae bacterium]